MGTSDTPTDLKVVITHDVEGQGGRYIAHLADSDHTGYLEWGPHDPDGDADIRIATHTVVPREIGGQGVAGKLVDRLVSDAREKGFTIVPRCSYVAKKFDENPDWADLRASV